MSLVLVPSSIAPGFPCLTSSFGVPPVDCFPRLWLSQPGLGLALCLVVLGVVSCCAVVLLLPSLLPSASYLQRSCKPELCACNLFHQGIMRGPGSTTALQTWMCVLCANNFDVASHSATTSLVGTMLRTWLRTLCANNQATMVMKPCPALTSDSATSKLVSATLRTWLCTQCVGKLVETPLCCNGVGINLYYVVFRLKTVQKT